MAGSPAGGLQIGDSGLQQLHLPLLAIGPPALEAAAVGQGDVKEQSQDIHDIEHTPGHGWPPIQKSRAGHLFSTPPR